jgi:hypothetical protein
MDVEDELVVALHHCEAMRRADAKAEADARAAAAKGGHMPVAIDELKEMMNILRRAASPKWAPTDIDSRTRCQVCGASFASRSELFTHIRKSKHGAFKQCTALHHTILASNWEASAAILADPVTNADDEVGENIVVASAVFPRVNACRLRYD